MHALLSMIGFFIPVAYAQGKKVGGGPGVAEMWERIGSVLYTKSDPVAGLAANISNFVFSLIAAIAVVLVVYAGIRIITARGKEDQVSQAKTIIIYALVGVILSLLARTVVLYVATYFLPNTLQ